jgi:hypothetical protein
MIKIQQAVKSGLTSPSSATAMLKACFPMLDDATIAGIVDEATAGMAPPTAAPGGAPPASPFPRSDQSLGGMPDL